MAFAPEAGGGTSPSASFNGRFLGNLIERIESYDDGFILFFALKYAAAIVGLVAFLKALADSPAFVSFNHYNPRAV